MAFRFSAAATLFRYSVSWIAQNLQNQKTYRNVLFEQFKRGGQGFLCAEALIPRIKRATTLTEIDQIKG